MKTKLGVGIAGAFALALSSTQSQSKGFKVFEIDLNLTTNGDRKSTEVTVNGFNLSDTKSRQFAADFIARAVVGGGAAYLTSEYQATKNEYNKYENIVDSHEAGKVGGSLITDWYYSKSSKKNTLEKIVPVASEILASRLERAMKKTEKNYHIQNSHIPNTRALGNRIGKAIVSEVEGNRTNTWLHVGQAVGEQAVSYYKKGETEESFSQNIPVSAGANAGLAFTSAILGDTKGRNDALIKTATDAAAGTVVNQLAIQAYKEVIDKTPPTTPGLIKKQTVGQKIVHNAVKQTSIDAISAGLFTLVDSYFRKGQAATQTK